MRIGVGPRIARVSRRHWLPGHLLWHRSVQRVHKRRAQTATSDASPAVHCERYPVSVSASSSSPVTGALPSAGTASARISCGAVVGPVRVSVREPVDIQDLDLSTHLLLIHEELERRLKRVRKIAGKGSHQNGRGGPFTEQFLGTRLSGRPPGGVR